MNTREHGTANVNFKEQSRERRSAREERQRRRRHVSLSRSFSDVPRFSHLKATSRTSHKLLSPVLVVELQPEKLTNNTLSSIRFKNASLNLKKQARLYDGPFSLLCADPFRRVRKECGLTCVYTHCNNQN